MPIVTKKLPSQDRLREVFYYDGQALIWRKTSPNTIKVLGKIAGCMAHGYRQIQLDGENYYASRLIWKYVYGVDPRFIDHINGNRSDNRVKNLRSVDFQTNSKNAKRHKNNTSGINGVSWFKAGGKWQSDIRVDGKRIFLGYFDSLPLAVAARNQANIKYGFHPNHGREVSL